MCSPEQLEAGGAQGQQEGYLQGRGVCLHQSMDCCLKSLTPLLLPVNGILKGLEGKAGLEGHWGCPDPGHPAGMGGLCPLSQHLVVP